MHIPRMMLAATSSGAGKTLLACGLLQAWKNQGLQVVAFKCGPDYIDPMFHREVLGIPGYNLDTFLCGRTGVRKILLKNGGSADIAVLEGVMGYYDGLGGISTDASAYDVAKTTETPAVLIVDCKGSSLSVVPYIQGFLRYKCQNSNFLSENSYIAGVIFNRLSPSLYGRMKELVERETGIKVYGYLPVLQECRLESRHLGLKMPGEVVSFRQKIEKLAGVMEETLELEKLLKLAESAPELEEHASEPVRNIPELEENKSEMTRNVSINRQDSTKNWGGADLRIGLARDQAFCFFYQDNLDLLKEQGAELISFSPLEDSHLPDSLDGLLLYGGYPELFAGQLSRNVSMRREVRLAVTNGLPCMAECGGFMYLQQSLTDEKGSRYSMAGALPGNCFYTPSLKRFGYITLSGGTVFGNEIGEIPAHEFHYYDSEINGSDFCAKKPLSQRKWECMISTETLLAGYPHIHYRGNPKLAEAFLSACRRRKNQR